MLSVTVLAGAEINSRGTEPRFNFHSIDLTLVDFTTGIGGYFALKAQRDVPVVCVTPYLENREADPAFRKLRRLVTSPLAPVLAFSLASFSTLLGIVPRVVRRRLLRAAGALSLIPGEGNFLRMEYRACAHAPDGGGRACA